MNPYSDYHSKAEEKDLMGFREQSVMIEVLVNEKVAESKPLLLNQFIDKDNVV